jgi:hypothetical protein
MRDEGVLGRLLAVVVDDDAAHPDVRDDWRVLLRVLPQNKVARVLERDVLHAAQRLGSLALLDLSPVLVLLLLRADLGEADRDVLRELEGRAVKGAGLVLRQAGLVLRVAGELG